MRSVLSQPVCDVLVNLHHIFDAVHPPRDTGLICDHRDRDPGPVEAPDRFRGSLNEVDAVDGADVSVISDDSAVAIEKDSGPQT